VDVVVVASVVVVVVDVETAMGAWDWKTSFADDVDATSAASASREDDAGSVEVGSRDMSVVATRCERRRGVTRTDEERRAR